MKKSGKKRNEINKFIKKSGVVKPEKPYKPFNVEFEEVSEARGSLIQLKDLTFGWSKDKILFENVELGIFNDSRFTIVGNNGIGKSSLFQVLLGKVKPISGEVIFKVCSGAQEGQKEINSKRK